MTGVIVHLGNGGTMIAAGFGEQNLVAVVDVAVQVVEAGGAIVICMGAVIAFARFAALSFSPWGTRMAPFAPLRLDLGRFLTLGLEFQLAADIVRTAVAPNFTELAQLAAIAAIRTALNFFLARETREERELIREDQAAAPHRLNGQTGPVDKRLSGENAARRAGSVPGGESAPHRQDPDK